MRKALGLILVMLLAYVPVAFGQVVNINQSVAPPPTTMQSAVTANGNGTSLTVSGYGQVLLDLTCTTCSGGTTVNFESSADNSVWTAVTAYQLGTSGTIGSSATATGMFQIPTGGPIRSIRARVSAYSAGTITVKGYLGVFYAAPLAGNVNVLGTVPVSGTFWQATQPVSGTFWQATQPVSGTVTAISGTAANFNATVVGTGTLAVQNTQAGTASQNVAQLAGTTTSVNSGNKDAGTLRVTLATDQVQLTNALKVDGSATTQPVSGTFWQATQPVSGTFWQATQPVSGTVTAVGNVASGATDSGNPVKIGAVYNSSPITVTNAQRADLQTDANGYLKVNVAAGGASGGTSSSFGSAFPATGTAIGFKDSAGTNMVAGNLDASGFLKVNVAAGSGGNGAASNTGSAVPTQADYQGVNVAGTLRGATAVNPSGSVYAQQTDLASVAGTTADVNSGNKSAGTLRVVIATDQPALTNKLLVTPDSVALPANQSVNVNQLAGTTTDTNSGSKSAGTLRVVLATDQPALTNKLLVTPDSVALPANQSVNVTQFNGTTAVNGSGNATGALRVELANNGTGVLATVGAVTAITNALPTGTNTIGSVKQTDGTNVVITDPCQGQTKSFIGIGQTAGATIITGTSAKKIYVCSLNLFTETAQNINFVEGTGTVCATGIATFPGFPLGTTAAVGYKMAANQGLTYGNGAASIAAATTNADNLCILQSGAGQVSGGISYVVQ